MKPPFNFTRFLPMAARLLGRGRLPTLLFAVAAKGSSQGSRLEGKGTFSSFNGAPQTVCNAPGAPYGVTIVVKNLDNGRSIACSNVMMPSTPANVVIVLHTRLFVELSDLVNAPIPVALTW
ncbi:MAG: hypothetical protein EBX51_04120 [Acidimicrobiia bacterium]|nr:hypothetical protein [Acidimicrobiia bacterium]